MQRDCSQIQQLQPGTAQCILPVRPWGFPRKMNGNLGHAAHTAMALQQHCKGCCYEKAGTRHTGVPVPWGALGSIPGAQRHMEEQSKDALASWLQ